jgi:hypothetical protein
MTPNEWRKIKAHALAILCACACILTFALSVFLLGAGR